MDLIQWKIIQVIPEIADTKTFVLEPINGEPVHWEAGQFLTFLFYHHGQELRRSYSICTAPGIDKYIAITVKKKVNGEISRHVLNHWQVGETVSSLPPSGRFTLPTDTSRKRHVYFIAAGSGIVPMLGLIKQLLLHEPYSQCTLLYQNTSERHIIYDEVLKQLAILHPQRFHRFDLLSNPHSDNVRPARLNNWLLEQLLTSNLKPQTSNVLFYTCGPELFMKMVQFTLRLLHYKEEQLRKEHFVIDPPRKPSFSLSDTPHKVVLYYNQNRYEFTTAFPNTILKAAQQHGINLPYSCNAGRCATCVAKCRAGSVLMNNNEVLTEKELAQGMVLTCTGYAETDIELSI